MSIPLLRRVVDVPCFMTCTQTSAMKDMVENAESLFNAFKSCEQNLNVTTMLPAFTMFMSTQMLPMYRIKVRMYFFPESIACVSCIHEL